MLNSKLSGLTQSVRSKFLEASATRKTRGLVAIAVIALAPMSLQAQSWSKTLGNSWAGLTLALTNTEYGLFGDKAGLSATGDLRASILKINIPLVEGWVKVAGKDKSYCETNATGSCAVWKRQVELGRFQKKYSELYGSKIPTGINWQRATFYANYGYRVFRITLKNLSEYGNEIYEKVNGYERPGGNHIGPPSPPRKKVTGNWARKTISKTIPLGPFGGINIGAGYAINPGYTFDVNQTGSKSSRVYQGIVRPEISTSVNAYGAYDAYLLKGGVRGDLMIFAGGIEAMGSFAQATRRVLIKYRPFYRYLGGKITAYAQHISGFSCRRHKWHFHCGRKWRTFWSKVLYQKNATTRYYAWKTIYNRVVSW